ncbi:hypothetical protein [Legionella worsleiensis]|uniref:Uncharacterized protein n=1 Tax=Legionella worsleiensis TaxID=45076 RepID=A0A0W1AIL9_9GAMM|nr:hypothetical protein [Legionella worsleiensis]KTD81201.1 hypothetical protein Lwor_0879 [Legionella worsleiensis]STY33178.1 Uncharacterised protein [Legionella worsleiensis]
MDNVLTWLPDLLGFKADPSEYRSACYQTYGGNPPRWGGVMDSCALKSSGYEVLYGFFSVLGVGYLVMLFLAAAVQKTNKQLSLEGPESSNEEGLSTLSPIR